MQHLQIWSQRQRIRTSPSYKLSAFPDKLIMLYLRLSRYQVAIWFFNWSLGIINYKEFFFLAIYAAVLVTGREMHSFKININN